MTSVAGKISSKNETTPATFPIVPLYIQAIINPESGAQTTSANSPIKGIEKDIIPTASNKRLKTKSLVLVFFSEICSICFISKVKQKQCLKRADYFFNLSWNFSFNLLIFGVITYEQYD